MEIYMSLLAVQKVFSQPQTPHAPDVVTEKSGSEVLALSPENRLADSPLSIKQINSENYPEARKVVMTWTSEAKKKHQRAQEETDLLQFNSAVKVGQSFVKDLQAEIKTPTQSAELYACQHRGEPQGLMLLSKQPNYIKIEWLMTNPKNLRSPQNDPKSIVAGVGTHAERVALESGKSAVHVSSAGSARGFYMDKLGYKSEDPWDPTLLNKTIHVLTNN
jgi:hypothetical protein